MEQQPHAGPPGIASGGGQLYFLPSPNAILECLSCCAMRTALQDRTELAQACYAAKSTVMGGARFNVEKTSNLLQF